MKATVRLVVAFVAVAFVAGPGLAADNKDLIVGKWSPAEKKGGGNATIEFTKDGKLKIEIEELKLTLNGTYKFTDDTTLEVAVEGPKGEKKSDKVTIKSISADKLVMVNPQGKEETLNKVK
jgi:uncharacterized protein (TIGR03066 family)